jgi:hypothetical protein
MYYRIAIQTRAVPSWRWVSTSLGSLNSVVDWLRFYNSFPRDRLRVLSASAREDLNEGLLLEDQGPESRSTPVARFLPIASQGPRQVLAAPRQATSTPQNSGSLHQFAWVLEKSGSGSVDTRRDELECGAGGDHDCAYQFSVPASAPELLAWARLLARVLYGDLQAETAIPGAA